MFKLTPRQGLIVYINNFHVLRRIRHYGHIMYVSRKMHYVVVYVNQKDIDHIEAELIKLHNVTKIDRSQWPNIDPNVLSLEATGVYKKNDEDNDK